MGKKQVLGIQLPTDPRWVGIAEKNIEDILVDHAYCEQKAASSCISLIVQYSDKRELVNALTLVVAEEWDHFQRVLAELTTRGLGLKPPRRDNYVERLRTVIGKGGSRAEQLGEKLLFNAMIEARSCERFRLLSKHIADENLRQFYHDLMVSEAGHYKLFLSLARTYSGVQWTQTRWKKILEDEAHIVSTMVVRDDRMH